MKQSAATIKVIGVGGGGGNTVNHMVRTQTEGAEYFLINTDKQHLDVSLVPEQNRILIGDGLGAGAQPEVARAEAEKAADEIAKRIGSADLIFIAAGMGGGTGTGAAPEIAKIVRSAKSSSPGKRPLVVGVTTLPFRFEGKDKMRMALEGLEQFKQHCDAYIVVPNENLLRIAGTRMSMKQAFAMVDDILRNAVHGLVGMIQNAGDVNLDMADVRTTLAEAGECLFGTGTYNGSTQGRSDESPLVLATRNAINSPLLDVSIKGATRVLINFVGKSEEDLDILQLNEAAQMVSEQIDPNARLIWGLGYDQTLPDHSVRVNLIVGGLKTQSLEGAQPEPHGVLSGDQLLAKVAAAQDVVTTVKEFASEVQEPKRWIPSFLRGNRTDRR